MSSSLGSTASVEMDPAVSPSPEVDPFADTVKVLTIRPRSEMHKRDSEVTETFDEESTVRIFKVPGLNVLVPAGKPTIEGLARVAERAKARPSDLSAVIFSSPPPLDVRNFLCERGFLVAEYEAESLSVAARRYAEEFSKRVQEGVENLERFSAAIAKDQAD